MLAIDPRAGSKDLVPYFKPYDIEVELTELEFGDLYFMGNGHQGTVAVGIEHKQLLDVIASMRNGRLSGHQIPGMLKLYDHVILLIEGVWRCGKDGALEILRHEWMPVRSGSRMVLYRELSNYLVSLEFICGVVVQRSGSPQETAAYVTGLYQWFNKEWDEHDVQHVIYTGNGAGREHRRAGFTRKEPGPVEIVASVLPGVATKAWEFGKVFKSVEELVAADEKKLCTVEGIGKVGAKKIRHWIQGIL